MKAKVQGYQDKILPDYYEFDSRIDKEKRFHLNTCR